MAEGLYDREVYSIVGAAYEVQKVLRGGLSEAIYEEALCRELEDRGIEAEEQKELTIYYKDKPLEKKYRVDILCEEDIIIELKAVEKIISEHRAQLFNYLRLMDKPVGILINFSMHGVEIEKYLYDMDNNDFVYYNLPKRTFERLEY